MNETGRSVSALGAQLDPDSAIELADLLTHAMRRLRRGTRDALAPLGLSGSQARVVRLLADGPLRMAAIAERLGVVPRTATDMVDSVEAAGLVDRRVDPDDRRSVLVDLAPGGRLLIERLDAARLASAREVFDALTPAQREDLLGLLRTLCGQGESRACAAPDPGATRAPRGSGSGAHLAAPPHAAAPAPAAARPAGGTRA